MMVPEDLRYSEDHQWVRAEGELWRIGITAYAQDALGEVTTVLLAAPDTVVSAGNEMGEVEAFKAMTDLYMPVDGKVVQLNPHLAEQPTAVNDDPYGDGWLCLIEPTDSADLTKLLDAAGYRTLIGVTEVDNV